MFNFFAHSPLQDEALRFFTAQLLGSAGAFPHPNNPDALAAYGAAVNRDEAATVRAAAQLAHAHGKRALTFKIFGQSDTMLRMFAGYSNNSVAILLERNVFTATVSALKIDSGWGFWRQRVPSWLRHSVTEQREWTHARWAYGSCHPVASR